MYTNRLNQSFGKFFLIVLIALSGIFTVLPSGLMAEGAIELEIVNQMIDYNSLDMTYDLPVMITTNTALYELGGFELNFTFNPDEITLVDVVPGSAMENCGWEYLTFRQDETGFIVVIGLADTADGPNHPSCYFSSIDDELFHFQFYIPDTDSAECINYEVNFYWKNCGCNIFSNTTGDTLFGSSQVFQFEYNEITANNPTPSYTGMPDICLDSLSGESVTALREVIFRNGFFSITCADIPNDRGDVNLNSVAYEIADYVMFQDYFLHGLRIFTTNPELQTLNSDINNDGRYLETGDLVYLWLILVGDALPFPDKSPAQTDTAYFIQDLEQKTITMDYPDSLVTAAFTFLGNIDLNEADVNGVPTYYIQQDDTTRVLILDYDNGPNSGEAFGEGLIFSYTGTGQLISLSCSGDWGVFVPTRISHINADYICGDANNDAVVNISDAVYLLGYIFSGGSAPDDYLAGDPNCDGRINISDVVYIITYVFRQGNEPCDTNGDGSPDC